MKSFSKLTKLEKMNLVIEKKFEGNSSVAEQLKSFWHPRNQELFDQFSENTLSNFYLPFGVVPNFVLNGKEYTIPMAIEESSVVAACSKSAGFWKERGGFNAEVVSTSKVGQIHLSWDGDGDQLQRFFKKERFAILQETVDLTINMDKRGGGIKKIDLLDRCHEEANYYQVQMEFDTCNAMGANFINSVLERVAKVFKLKVEASELVGNFEIIMAILSNYTPNCLVRAWVSCSIDCLADPKLDISAEQFATKMIQAVNIAKIDPYRATTHNKGIFNGIDAVVIATGNDFRAVEAAGHTYACRDGQYRGLTDAVIDDGKFILSLDIPLSVGTVGGLTSLHPLARISLEMLGKPDSKELMGIIAAAGLAQNYAALRSLVTSGIQKGHMKMHLMNILNHLKATSEEREKATHFFSDQAISFASAREFISSLRGN